ncbi:MAG: BBP7 family outer membrane beta-barrel protein [Planctomycetaceae bacterium]|nr:BBP7 family outer membrane beta-barrel protein [Planctomycetaceae bacterium]
MAYPAQAQQAAGGLGVRSVAMPPQRLPIWGPSRQDGTGQPAVDSVSTSSAQTAGSLGASGSLGGGSARGVVAAPVSGKVGSLHAPYSEEYGLPLEPVVTEGPGNDLVVVVPPLQPGTPLAPPYRSRLWLDFEYLMWWLEGSRTPPLVTSGIGGSVGILGETGTDVLFPTSLLNSDMRSGFRAGATYWFDNERQIGIDGDYLIMLEESEHFSISSDGNPVLARPYFDVVAGHEDSHVFAFPDAAIGTIAISSDSCFQAAGICLRKAILETNDVVLPGDDGAGSRVDWVVGYRFVQLDEGLTINESFEAAGPTRFDLHDSFDAENTFHGVNLGMLAEMRCWGFSLELAMLLALGHSSADVVIDGTTTTTAGGAPAVSDGGLLALATNSGSYTQNNLAAIPELGVTLGYNITQRLRATLGYSFIYWSRVARPGEQIDRNLNPSYFPDNGPPAGAPLPEFVFMTSDMWIQGIDFGVDFRF